MNDDLQMLRSSKNTETVFVEKTESKIHSFFKNKLGLDLSKIWSAFGIVLLTLFIYLTSNGLTLLILSPFNENVYTIYGMYISTIFIILFVYFNNKNISVTCKLNKINWRLGLKCIPVAIFLLLSTMLYFFTLDKLGFNLSSLSSRIQTNNIRVESIFGILTVTLVGPIIEEFLTRGFLLSKLREVLNIKTAIIIQAIFFAVLHGNSFRFLDTFIFGIVMGCFCYYTNSIFPGIIMHIANNSFNTFNGLIVSKLPFLGQVVVSCIYIILGIIGAYILFTTLKSFKLKKN